MRNLHLFILESQMFAATKYPRKTGHLFLQLSYRWWEGERSPPHLDRFAAMKQLGHAIPPGDGIQRTFCDKWWRIGAPRWDVPSRFREKTKPAETRRDIWKGATKPCPFFYPLSCEIIPSMMISVQPSPYQTSIKPEKPNCTKNHSLTGWKIPKVIWVFCCVFNGCGLWLWL